MRREALIDLVLGVALPALATCAALLPLLSRPGYIFYGDERWLFYLGPSSALHDLIANYFYAWNGYPTTPNTLYYVLLSTVLLQLGGYAANHLLTFLLAFLPGPAAYFGILRTIELYRAGSLPARLAAAAGSLFYLINWQNPGLITPMYTWAPSYIVLPLLLYLALRAISRRDLLAAALFGAVASLGDSVPTWIPFMAVFVLVALLVHLAAEPGAWRGRLAAAAMLVASSLVFSLYVVLPAGVGFTSRAGGAYIAYQSVSWGFVVFQSFYRLIDVLMYGQPSFYYFGFNPRNWGILSPFILASAALPALLARRMGRGLALAYSSVAMSLAAAIFLAKGANPPLGGLYRLVAAITPPGVAGMIWEPTFWTQLVGLTLSFSMAISALLGIELVLDRGPSSRRILGVLLIALVALGLAAGIRSASISLGYYTYERFEPTFPPGQYFQLMEYVEQHPGYAVAVPNGGGYYWKLNGTLPLTSFDADWLPEYSPAAPYLSRYVGDPQVTAFGRIMALGQARYLLVDASGGSINATRILAWANSQVDLRLVWHEGPLYLYENEEPLPEAWIGLPAYGNPLSPTSVSAAFTTPSTVYVNGSGLPGLILRLGLFQAREVVSLTSVPPSGTSIRVPGGEEAIVAWHAHPTDYAYEPSEDYVVNITEAGGSRVFTVHYEIPSYDVARGYRGSFWAGFNVAVEVYPYGQCPPSYNNLGSNLVLEVLGPQQLWHDADSGYIRFSIPGNLSGVSIYMDFYDCCFAPISPLYYLGSVVNGSFVVEPFAQVTSAPQQYEILGPGDHVLVPVVLEEGPGILDGTFSMVEYCYAPSEVLLGEVNASGLRALEEGSNVVAAVYYSPTSAGAERIPLLPGQALRFPGNYTVALESPFPGTYVLRLDVVSGNVSLDGAIYGEGIHEVPIELPVNSTLSLSSAVPGAASLEAELLRVGSDASLLEFAEASPVEYVGEYSSNTTALISIAQPYSPLWRLELNGSAYPPVPAADGATTGFLVPPGHGRFVISYAMQPYLEAGYLATAAAWALLLFAYLWRRRSA